ncbi:dynein heavy chain 14, axonemal-like isoform X2 [Ochotona curzoniae]|uniref:dynein heavy chain 14, axonemal-like isoform X2 n=1 Tax=Ochotona curzoniae TaxID=130825 RepID=UPI001B34F0C1|nr:dynein heavy chain 14, axonemal-like isoform X2 [Ochotona curzoniae]
MATFIPIDFTTLTQGEYEEESTTKPRCVAYEQYEEITATETELYETEEQETLTYGAPRKFAGLLQSGKTEETDQDYYPDYFMEGITQKPVVVPKPGTPKKKEKPKEKEDETQVCPRMRKAKVPHYDTTGCQ